jgi:hypothetical protein
VQNELKALVQGSLTEMVDSYIRSRSKRTDIAEFLNHELICTVVEKELRSLVEGCIHGLVDDFILEKEVNSLFDQLLYPIISEVVWESFKDWELEELQELILNKILSVELPLLVIEVLEEAEATV